MADSVATLRQRRTQRADDLLERYIRILEAQHEAIYQRDVDHLDYTVRLERRILEDLEALARVRLPGLPQGVVDSETRPRWERARSLQRTNRELLAERSAELARQINALKIPPQRRSVYTAARGGTMIDTSL